MSENALDCKGELGRYSTRPNQKWTREWERASGISHPCGHAEAVRLSWVGLYLTYFVIYRQKILL